MMRFVCTTAVLLAVASLAIDRQGYLNVASAQGDQHAYFNALVKRSDYWKSYSFRDPAQLECRREGGYAEGCGQKWVTYSPSTDTDRHKQDAAKVVIQSFYANTVLTQPAAAGDTVLTVQFAAAGAYNTNNKHIKVDQEVMKVTGWISNTSLQVTRGAFGTTPAPHASGAVVMRNGNSLGNQVRVPLLTEDGHSYLFTWDGYWTDSYINMWPMAHKAFQFGNGGSSGNQIWLEPQSDYGGYHSTCFDRATRVFSVDFRSYNTANKVTDWTLTDGNQVGPGTVNQQMNKSGEFCAKPNTWTRWWVRINQRANDWDDLDAWVADETTEAVQILRNLKISVRPTGSRPNQIADFWIEFNTSTDDHLRPDGRDLVAYVRNFVALRDAGDVSNLLVRPVPGAEPVAGPGAPRNVRIFRTSE